MVGSSSTSNSETDSDKERESDTDSSEERIIIGGSDGVEFEFEDLDSSLLRQVAEMVEQDEGNRINPGSPMSESSLGWSMDVGERGLRWGADDVGGPGTLKKLWLTPQNTERLRGVKRDADESLQSNLSTTDCRMARKNKRTRVSLNISNTCERVGTIAINAGDAIDEDDRIVFNSSNRRLCFICN